ncbi:hypothetical protein FQR65_LT02787 [Abscondita terminalis]|nr:hypothetical protein FQR65_LT02787 [Abscondita terminalis]
MTSVRNDNICRTCMSETKTSLSIFNVQLTDANTVQMAEFLNNLTLIEISKDDGLPQQLCIPCIDAICKTYDFIQMCKESDVRLRIPHVDAESEAPIFNNLSNLKNKTSNDDEHVDKNMSKKNHVECDKAQAKDNLYKCTKCKQVFSTEFELTNHNSVHDSISYECKECLKSFTKKRFLNVHIRSHHNVQDKHVCKVCGQTFNYSYMLKQHSFKHKDEKPFPCTKCRKGCLTAESLRRHMKVHEEGYIKKVHACPVCNKEFIYPSFLSEHMKNHTGEKPFLCSTCGKGFRQKGALDYHVRSHTGYKPYKCEVCHNSFTCRGALRVHMRRHTDERPYICDICGVGFHQSTDMNRHRLLHNGTKPALCTICGKQFSTTGQLTIHLRTHTGEKPFGCEVCQKAFTTRTMLIKHQRIHTGERPYTCKICGRSFTQSGTLKTHGMVHLKNSAIDVKLGNLKNGKEQQTIFKVEAALKAKTLPPVTVAL